ncbi:transcriptional regulator [Saccharothrix sp. AJ9571]|nr:transcriptional regulator [Saccharothrix sp. AJ9571]
MTKDYGRPPRADENRVLIGRRRKEVADAGGPRETVTVDWRGRPTHLDVIQMPIGELYYNPATHRIRAQRSHDPKRDKLLETQPWAPESQEYLGFLLKALPANPASDDPEFAKLKSDLETYGQNEPGLITPDGVLVNGNTRRAALLDLGPPTQNMRVGVLPDSCDWNDVRDIELSLQLRKEHRRDYSYINRLLAIDELAAQGHSAEAIASIFRIRVSTCRQDQWVLSCIRSMIERSQESGVRLPLVAFEDQTEKLRELHRRYAKDAAVNQDQAALILESRLAAIMLGKSKTDVRLIEPDFQDRYLRQLLPDELKPETETSSVQIPGLGRTVKGPSQTLAAAKALTDTVLKAKAVSAAGAALPEATRVKAEQKTQVILGAMERALDYAGKDDRVRKRKQAAPDRLVEATRMVEQCTTDLVISRGSRSLDEELFDEEMLNLKKSLAKLAREARRTIAEPGDGVSWLLDAMQVES